ncbi:metal-dependent hydrolase [Hymenobacter psychrotolerans]|uniref:Inner membrane protein n=1 Tax=Hymenobacter psychrotolerans DSM 18569 TaxID=1121959 RepID=A0A1M7DXD0_9BACT|nr:metal-dependent hydrolase [Hymenobacter psychrotolerans]SHL83819.1 inner membrane protein [Hymenobacter psychrotolerans DSM 18569]
MASIFGHCALGATLGKLLLPDRQHWRYWVLAAACAFLPDADVIGFKFHVPYASLWGHRGLTHSIVAAALLATALAGLNGLRRSAEAPAAGRLWLLLFLATASHGVLDAMTTGGEGVAFYSPFDQQRYFFGFRPIQVSPIGVKKFVGEWAARVLKSEVLWVGVPCVLLLVGQRLTRLSRTLTHS